MANTIGYCEKCGEKLDPHAEVGKIITSPKPLYFCEDCFYWYMDNEWEKTLPKNIHKGGK